MDIGSINGLVTELPLCSAVFVNQQTLFLQPFGNDQTPSLSTNFAKFTAHIEILCADIQQLRRGHG
tara:strand:+ start:12820 stop:13017 length:198 start_codon:yes stop_codon:yes gene_type:complete